MTEDAHTLQIYVLEAVEETAWIKAGEAVALVVEARACGVGEAQATLIQGCATGHVRTRERHNPRMDLDDPFYELPPGFTQGFRYVPLDEWLSREGSDDASEVVDEPSVTEVSLPEEHPELPVASREPMTLIPANLWERAHIDLERDGVWDGRGWHTGVEFSRDDCPAA